MMHMNNEAPYNELPEAAKIIDNEGEEMNTNFPLMNLLMSLVFVLSSNVSLFNAILLLLYNPFGNFLPNIL